MQISQGYMISNALKKNCKNIRVLPFTPSLQMLTDFGRNDQTTLPLASLVSDWIRIHVCKNRTRPRLRVIYVCVNEQCIGILDAR